MRPRNLISALVLTLCALSGLEPVRAENLIPNSGFQHSTTGWSKSALSPHKVSWAPKDERDSPFSGSLTVSDLVANLNANTFTDCLAVTPGDTLTFGASITAEGGGSGVGRIAIWFFSDPTCGGSSERVTPLLRTSFPVSNWGASQGTAEVPAGAIRAFVVLTVNGGDNPPDIVYFDNVFLEEGVSCVGTETVACLNEDRFRLNTIWRTPDGTQGWARVVELTDDSAYLWFFQNTNIEQVVKVLDACSFADRFWVFAAGLTNVEVDVDVTDTLTGETWSYTNPLGQAFLPVQDTAAFATCAP